MQLKNTSIIQFLKKILGRPLQQSLTNYLKEFALENDEVTFLQVGSNDGKTGDPIYPFVTKRGWRGILVEPIPGIFQKLRQNYRGFENQLLFENIAIGNESKIQTFFALSDSFQKKYPVHWADQLGSLDRHVIVKHKHKFPDIEDYITEIRVPTMSINDLLHKHFNFLGHLDLLHIDAEGLDYQILKEFNFKMFLPHVIIYEHIHLTELNKQRLNWKLMKNGYALFWDSKDTYGVKKK
ncbi:MAG: FkbM family methyltransferase [Cyclobacteriaceae bacterium]